MGQGGNVWEWIESAQDGVNNSPSKRRKIRGGDWLGTEFTLRSSEMASSGPTAESINLGFRVASVPEPSTYALLVMTGAGALWMTRRRR